MKRVWLLVLVMWSTMPYEGFTQSWSDVPDPTPGTPRAVGTYTAGCVQGALPLPPEGPGFQTMRRYRRRFFGHPTLIRYLQELAQATTQHGLGTLSIGDLGQARGGPTPSGHASHQHGLDVDIWFWLLPNGRTLPSAQREVVSAPSLVTADGRALEPRQWSPRHAQVLQLAAGFEAVERIFVNAVIKQALCEQFPGAAWLRKLRPWWGHADHFHVRLRCPRGDVECQGQEPTPPGDGCGAELAWWLTDEARKPPPRVGTGKVLLPEACDAILRK
jgi:penicillin-insensitive murein endopeptidase